jgi:hypothetical protein
MKKQLVRLSQAVREWQVTGWMLFAVVILGVTGTSAQVAQNAAEQFVQQQLATNGVADLDKSGLKDRTLRHEFLEDLISTPKPPDAVATHGLTVRGAAINGRLSVGSVTVSFPLTFDSCTFEEGFDLSSNVFVRDFLLIHSHVGSASLRPDPPTFEGDRFAGKVSLDGTVFHNGVDFTGAEIEGILESDDVVYESDDDEADFTDVKVHGRATFRQSLFRGGLDLTDAELADLVITDASSGGISSAPPKGIDLLIDHASISKGLMVKNVALSGLGARLVNVQGQTELQNVVPLGRTYFAGSKFQALRIRGFDPWLSDAKNVWLDGLTYASIDFPDSRTKPPEKGWLQLIDAGPYTPQPYTELERFLRDHGGYNYADQVYFNMRRKQRLGLSALQGALDRVQDWLLGYGRDLRMAGLLILVLIAVGVLVFKGDRMVQEDKDCTDNWYSPIWFSVDLLSPIDLGVSKKWRAKSRVLRHYAQCHRVAGWILIPLIVAAVTGIIK